MVKDDLAYRLIDSVLPRQLELLQQATGLPVVFGGPTIRTGGGQSLVLSHLAGTLTDSLRHVTVVSGRGLGGAVVAKGLPFRVNDYASASAITHDYDRLVVEHEKVTSVFAFPVKVRDQVYGVLYGAVRDRQPIGDIALRNAGAIASRIAMDLRPLIDRPEQPCASPSALPSGASSALEDLAAIAETVDDPTLRAQLDRIHRQLGGRPPIRPASRGGVLTPREVDVLRLVALGASNAEIAQELSLSLDTVKSYLRNAMRRLEVRNRTRAVLAARAAGLL